MECDFLDVHGNKQFILKNADLLFNAKGEIIGGIESFVDQSEKVKMTKELQEAKNKAEESDRLKTAFLANISHEIRTPLNAIIGFSELIADSENEHDAKQGFFEIIKSGSDQLLSILDKIMQLSLIEGGDVKIDHKVFDLNILVKGILQQHKTNISSKKLKLSLVQPEELSLNSDSTRISLIIDNLMENAVKFTDEGEIGFGYEANNDSVMFFISDTGCGIPANIGDKIFERFYRVKDPAHLTPGSGLGLPISKALVEALGGKIWYESEENKGTCFYFKIPNLYIKESINPITYSVLHMPSNQFG